MKRYLSQIITILFLPFFIWAAISWFEADKEVDILCHLFETGMSEGEVRTVLETGNYLQLTEKERISGKEILFNSKYNLLSSSCRLQFAAQGEMRSGSYRQLVDLGEIAALFATAGFIGMGTFQLFLAFGFPWGEMAWSGIHKVLPLSLRLVSLFSVWVFIFAAIITMEKVGMISWIGSAAFVEYGLWILTLLFALSTIGNQISRSSKEKKIMTPISLLLFLFTFLVALSPA